jgi:hypothetical protein
MGKPVTCKFEEQSLVQSTCSLATDIFRFHMHGNGLSYQDFSQYAESANDGVGKTLYTKAVDEGLWQVICHVQNHQTRGMLANYRIYPADDCPLPPLQNPT